MIKQSTIIIEMTGIFGAGYIPKLFKPLISILREKYFRLDCRNRRKRIETRYYVDTTLAYKKDAIKKERLSFLLDNIKYLNTSEQDELINLLKWTENLFKIDIEHYKRSIDIIFRRGGKLQEYILLKDAHWLTPEIERLPAKLSIFLKADFNTIKQTYEKDTFTLNMIKKYPDKYNQNPELAYQSQEEWLERVRNYPGLTHIMRNEANVDQFANKIIDKILPTINLFGLKTKPKTKVFISYSHNDFGFALKLEKTLRYKNIHVWIDKKEILVGDSLIKKIKEGIDECKYVCALISKNSINSKWVQEELDKAMNQQINMGEIKVLPLVLEPNLKLPSFLEGKLYLNFSISKNFDEKIEELMKRLEQN